MHVSLLGDEEFAEEKSVDVVSSAPADSQEGIRDSLAERIPFKMCASLASVCTKHSLVPVCTHSPAWILFAVKRYRHVREARRRWSASVAAGQAWLEYFRDVSLTGACAVGDSC